jgi:hypothetical protein
MLKRTLIKSLRLILAFNVAISLLTGCGKPKASPLLPMPESPTVEVEPERNPPHYILRVAEIAVMISAVIIMKHPTPLIVLPNIVAWLAHPSASYEFSECSGRSK